MLYCPEISLGTLSVRAGWLYILSGCFEEEKIFRH
jgi:hypothetical protein